MVIFALDDEPLLLRAAERVISEVAPDAQILTFMRAEYALKVIEEEGIVPDAVFADIEMPGMNGLEFASRIKELNHKAHIIFTTGYTEYAVDAYKIHVDGYVMKPLMADRIREELDLIKEAGGIDAGKLKAICFGYFEVFWQGTPLRFRRRKTKELLAFMIDRAGVMCTVEEIADALWENEVELRKAKDIIRHLVQDMRHTFREIGMEDVLIRRSGQMAVRCEMFDCDYFRFIEGNADAMKDFDGEYMTQYSWAEYTLGRLAAATKAQ